jgi:hypothetical protein
VNKHLQQHEHAGRTVLVKTRLPLHGQANQAHMPIPFLVEDWWDRVYGGSWMYANGNFACMHFAARSGVVGLPLDDEVVYGKTGDGLGHLVHASEIHEVLP